LANRPDATATVTSELPEPSGENSYCAAHVRLLRDSLRRWTGRELIDGAVGEADAGRWLFEAPFAVLSHGVGADPIFSYGNRTALALFEMSWQQLVATPSRFSALPDGRVERARLLEQVSAHGFIDDYAGIRVSRTGRRFHIRRAVVWALLDGAGVRQGQAAMFTEWQPVAPDA
jgi:MEKHLA domain